MIGHPPLSIHLLKVLGDHVLLVVHRQDALHVLLPGQTDMEAVILDLLLQPPGQLTVFRGLAVQTADQANSREAAVEDWRASKCSISCRSSSRRAGDGSSSSLLW